MNTLTVETYDDRSGLLNELVPLADKAAVALGWNAATLPALLPAWKAGNVLMITDRAAGGLLVGAACVLRTPSAIHSVDGLVLLLIPAEDRLEPLLRYMRMVAQAHGCRGLSMSVDVNAPLALLDALRGQGYTAKAVTMGVKL